MNYRGYLGITSQLPFCSVPLRLDSFNKCSFGCTYCFAKSRGGNLPSNGLKIASSASLENRLVKVQREKQDKSYSSALNEFLGHRVPIQFGGMTDPFSSFEEQKKVTVKLLSILNTFDYPTLISTKSTLLQTEPYITLLSEGNYYVRISITGASGQIRERIEKGVESVTKRLKVIENLSSMGVPVSVRLQPIIPGHEEGIFQLIEEFANVGVKHVSAEYLKWPIEYNSEQAKMLANEKSIYRQFFDNIELIKSGREWLLPAEYRFVQLSKLKEHSEKYGLTFGFAETDMLHFNSFSSCCNAADLYLRDASFNDFTFPNILKKTKTNEIYFPENFEYWVPSGLVGTYLNSKSRAPLSINEPDMMFIMRTKWNENSWRGGPESYYGISYANKKDDNGNKIYISKN